jgi:hypothetical protein
MLKIEPVGRIGPDLIAIAILVALPFLVGWTGEKIRHRRRKR